MVCVTNRSRALLAFCLFSLAFAFQEDTFIVNGESSYPYYPVDMFESITFRTLSPEERTSSTKSDIRTTTDFIRPFAAKPFAAGEVILTLPIDLGISGTTILQEIPVLESATFSYVEEPFLVWLLYHRNLGDASPHNTFVKSIPNYINPLTFTNDDWGKLGIDHLSTRMNTIVNADRELITQTRVVLIKKLAEIEGAEDLVELLTNASAEEYIWAYVAIKDNIRQTPVGLFIFPGMKFSHSPSAASPIFSDNAIHILAGSDIEVGDEVFINYGNMTNHDLLLHHAIFLENNPFDCLYFSVTTKNPYWSIISEHYFGKSSNNYESCLEVNFQPSSQTFIEMRAIVANSEQLNDIDSILEGKTISIENELSALRATYYALSLQHTLPLEELPDPEGSAAVELWNMYAENQQLARQSVTERIKTLWGLYL